MAVRGNWAEEWLLGAELGADLLRVGMMQVVEDVQGLLPRLPGLLSPAAGVAGVAKVGDRDGFLVAVTDFPVEAECLPIAVGRLVQPPEVMFGVTDAVPRVRHVQAVAELAKQRQGLPGVLARPLVVAAQRVAETG